MGNPGRWLRWSCLCIALAGAVRADPGPAPPLAATALDGSRFDLSALRGQVVLVNFWATWCAPCRAELPAFAEFARAHRDQGLQVLAVSTDDAEDLPQVREIAAGLPFPVALAAQTEARGYGRIWRLPITFVIDREGRLVVDGGRGTRKTWDRAALDAEVLPLLAAH